MIWRAWRVSLHPFLKYSALRRLADPLRLVGGIITSIAPSAIALSGYLCVSDSLLISQCWYYTTLEKREASSEETSAEERRESRHDGSETDSLIRRSDHSADQEHEPFRPELAPNAKSQIKRSWVLNALFILGVYVTGIIVWLVSHGESGQGGDGMPDGGGHEEQTSTIGVLLGYLSAICYLG